MFTSIKLVLLLLAGMVLFVGCGSSGGGSDDTQTPLVNSTDSEAPKITMNGKSSVTIIEGATYTDAGATAKDTVDGTVNVVTSGSVDSSKVGIYIITYTAVDKAGNKATKKRTVNVVAVSTPPVDKIAPVITIKGDKNVSIVQGTKYIDAGATAKDNVDGTVKVTTSGSVNSSKLGEYTITYTAIDKSGNKATATRKVNVTLTPDKVAPIITISGDNPLKVTQGETFSDPGATATDDRDGTVAVTPSGTVDMSTVANYTITYTAIDKAGNKITATRTVTVKPANVVWEVSNMQEFRQALEDATANGESDRIVLAKGTYNVTSDGLGTFKFDDNEEFNLTIQAQEGLTFKDVILDGNNSTQIFKFNNTASATLIFKGVSVINGKNGIYCNKNIEVEDCNISNNSSRGFSSLGTAKVVNSTISNNRSSGDGGGFFSRSKTTVINSTISNNYVESRGGGFFSIGATTITNSTISNNISTNTSYYSSYGGGFFSGGATAITNSTIANNTSSHNSYYSSSSYGGGFYSSGGTITVTNSTISNNSASEGGGCYSRRSTTIINKSIISNNTASKGAGCYFDSGRRTTTVTNSIFSENNSTIGTTLYASVSYISNNVFIKNRGSIYTQGIFINNIFTENDEDINLNFNSKIYNNYIDYNKIEDNGHNVIKKTNLQPASVGDVYLTSKYALESESPVIDKGLNPSSATYKKIIGNDSIYTKMLELLKTDKVGNKRIHNNTIDMGAVEYGASK